MTEQDRKPSPDRSSGGKPSLGRPSLGKRTLKIGSCFAAGAMMLSHLNRSGLTRYDDLIADLARLDRQHEASRQGRGRSAGRPLQDRPDWADWINR